MRTFNVTLLGGEIVRVEYPRSWAYAKIEQAIFSQYPDTREILETVVDIW